MSWIFAGISIDSRSCNETFPEVSISCALSPLGFWFSKGTSDAKLFKYLSLNKWAGQVLSVGREHWVFLILTGACFVVIFMEY